MPRSAVLLSAEPADANAITRAAAAVWQTFGKPGVEPVEVFVIGDGGAFQVGTGGRALATFTRPAALVDTTEIARLLPAGVTPPPGIAWWMDVFVPWDEFGLVGLGILQRLRDDLGGVVVTQ